MFDAILIIILTISVFFMMEKLYIRLPNPILLPALTSTILLASVLVMFHIPYETYMLGGEWINKLLGPAVVALAIPLYKQRLTLKKYLLPILAGVSLGAFVGILSGTGFAKWIGMDKEMIYTILPKSVTTPVAIEIASSLGGIPTLAAVFVIFAGLVGAIGGPYLIRLFRIDGPLAKGIGFGTASHAFGTVKALEQGELEGAISSVAMTLCALITSVISSIVMTALGW
ncbi:LrgB family protein [Massilibacterium senegalense]|uniref:LrgB family protein n=1 Tax=Massilibacterium senegalense TaxID=1632858 RepID=UPI000781ED3A|nr:LrgB family protein [Massilibacterium senegalense]